MGDDLKDKTIQELERLVVGLGQKKYLAAYIFKFVQRMGVTELEKISPLSKAFRGELAERGYFISSLDVAEKLVDADGTVKYVFDLGDGNRVESVLLTDEKRRTLCVSTQVGCAMGCAFCATAKVKLRRNLTAGEIVDQVICAERDGERVSNVVYMGMGEPLMNYDAVLKSIAILNHSGGKGIGVRHLTISTCGIAEGIRRLAGEELRPRLALSLNAPTNALRRELMPIAAKYPLADTIDAIGDYQAGTGQRVTFEYVMLGGVNDKVGHAKAVVRLLANLRCHVNLIEFNPHPGCAFVGSDSETIKRFASVLEAAGVETTVRFRMGRGICAACGQLGAAQAAGQGAE